MGAGYAPRMVVTGTSVDGSRAGAELAESRPGQLYATAGVHPHDAKSCDETTMGALRELAGLPLVVAMRRIIKPWLGRGNIRIVRVFIEHTTSFAVGDILADRHGWRDQSRGMMPSTVNSR